MTRPTFTPCPPPDPFTLPVQTEARTLEATFGDGYTQRAGDGLNALRRAVPAQWRAMPRDKLDAIVGFLEDRRGFEAFEWTIPGESTPRLFICKGWTVAAAGSPRFFTLSATFEQVFDI